jgi:uncharacterized protein (DUF488 family)
MNKLVIYTIGHSTHPLSYFLSLLQEYSITCLIDVRTIAASSYNPQFNKVPLSNFLRTHNITYLHFAGEFGARQTDPTLLDATSKVDFEKVRESQVFKTGISRLQQTIACGYLPALMCAESDPFDCHRFSMISVALQQQGFGVQHILKDKSLISNATLEKRLLTKYAKHLPKPNIFQPTVTPDDQLKAAYRLRNAEIAFPPNARASTQRHD